MEFVIGSLSFLAAEFVNLATTPLTYLCILGGTFIGLLFGSIPGITATTAVILMIPMSYYLPLDMALVLFLSAWKGGQVGGAISSITLGTPGTPGSVATVFDGYPLGQEGKGMKAMRMGLFASVIGDTTSDILTAIMAPVIGVLALRVGPPELVLLIGASLLLIGTVAAPMRGKEPGAATVAKAMASGALGITLTFVGMDVITGAPRMTYGSSSLILLEGFKLIPMFLGLFGVSRALALLSEPMSFRELKAVHLPPPRSPEDARLSLRELVQNWRGITLGTIMGTILGAAPGLGPNAAGLIAHGQGKLIAKDPSKYGQGSLEGVAVAESANSSVNGANLLPLVTLGIPGSGEAAVLMAAFLLHGVEVGPLLIHNYPEVIYRMFAGMLLANAGVLLVALLTMRHFIRAVTIPRNLLFPMILVLCFVGTWAREPLVIHLFMLVVFGVLGYAMNKTGFSTPALTIGFILGRIGEYSYNQTLIISKGSLWVILTRPAFLVLLLLLSAFFAFAMYVTRRRHTTTVTEDY